jgi:hypothetical protein
MRFLGQSTLIAAACGASLSVVANAQMPSLKGHIIGETVQQFLNSSDDLSARLALCRDIKDQKSARKHDINWDFCQQLIGAVDNKATVSVADSCSGIDMKTGAFNAPCLEFTGQVDFMDGKLAAMEVDLLDPWNTVYQDLIVKFGTPTHTGQETFKNLYGAIFYGSTAIWQSKNFTLVAIEKVENNKYMAGGLMRKVAITLATGEAMAKATVQAGARKSTLD